MIIELTGIPGAGKSSILEKIGKYCSQKEVITDIEKFIFNKSFKSRRFILFYDLLILSKLYLLTKKDLIVLKFSIKTLIKSGNNLFTIANIFRNHLKIIIEHRFLLKFDKTFIIDEGYFHISLSLFVDVSKDIDSKALKDFINCIPSESNILLIDASDRVLLDRVIARGSQGHRRIDFDNHKSVEVFMNQSRQVIETIKLLSKPSIFINEEYEINIDKILKLIKL